MRPRCTLFAILFVGPLLGGPRPALAQGPAVVDIRANPQRWMNRQVTLVGQAVQPVADPPGTTRGIYLLDDGTHPQGILVRTRTLPRPGPSFEVRGTVAMDASRNDVLLDEIARDEVDPGSPIGAIGGGGGGGGGGGYGGFRVDWGALGLVGLGILALGFALVLALRRGGTAASTPPVSPGEPGGTKIDLEIRVEEPGGDRRRERFRAAPITIGRDPSNDLVLDDPRVSRHHAEILVREGSLHVVDELSTHGTFVDGVRVESAEIRAGTTIRVGGTTMNVT